MFLSQWKLIQINVNNIILLFNFFIILFFNKW